MVPPRGGSHRRLHGIPGLLVGIRGAGEPYLHAMICAYGGSIGPGGAGAWPGCLRNPPTSWSCGLRGTTSVVYLPGGGRGTGLQAPRCEAGHVEGPWWSRSPLGREGDFRSRGVKPQTACGNVRAGAWTPMVYSSDADRGLRRLRCRQDPEVQWRQGPRWTPSGGSSLVRGPSTTRRTWCGGGASLRQGRREDRPNPRLERVE